MTTLNGRVRGTKNSCHFGPEQMYDFRLSEWRIKDGSRGRGGGEGGVGEGEGEGRERGRGRGRGRERGRGGRGREK